MAAPWLKYGQGATSPAVNPVIAPPDPYKQANEQRAQVDQSLQEAAARRDEARLQITADEAARRAVERQQGIDATESERKAGAFLIRALGSNEAYENADVGPRSYIGEKLRQSAPDLLNVLPSVIGNSPERQTADSAQDEFIAASLRQDSGAAIPPEELDRQRRIYFPMPGDTADVIEQKRQARIRAIEGLRQSAGRLEAGAEQRFRSLIEQYGADREPDPTGGTGASSDRWPGVIGEDGKPLPPEGGYGLDPHTGEWSIYVSVTDDSPAISGPLGPDGKPRITGNDPAYAQIAAGIGDLVQGGLNNTIGLLANPVNTNLFRALGYEGYTSDIGATVREGMGLPYGNETIGAINQAASGGISAAGAARSLGNVAAQGLTRNALLEYGSRPLLDMATGGTAAASGEAARQMGAGPLGQATATVVGGITPSAMLGARNALLNVGRGGSPPPDFDASLVRAGERQNIPIRLPDAVPSERGRMANAAQTPHGGPRIATARAADQEAVEARVQAVGGDGAVRDNYALGTTVQRAADRHIARTRAQANRLYDRARELAGEARVSPRNAASTLDRHIVELREAGANTNSDAIKYLEAVRGDIKHGLTIETVQSLRTNMRGQINGRNLTGTDTERRVRDVIEAMNTDLAEQLPEGAAEALQGADQFYRSRMEFIEQVSQRFIGPDNNRISAETAAQRLVSMVNGKGDAERFGRMWKELELEEQADLSATIAASLGRKANGEFSLSTLVRSLDPGKGINPRVARQVFGADGARALSDLRAIAAAKTATQQGMNNSNTGATVTRAAGGLKTLLLGALGYSAGGPVGAVGGAMSRDFISRLGEQRTARLLLNPDFTRWLRNAPNTTDPRVIDTYFSRLATSAAKSPILAGDARALQESLAEAFSRSPDKLAAREQEQN